jgi:hypothetical protein
MIRGWRFAWIALGGLAAMAAAPSALPASPNFPTSYRGDWFASSQSCTEDNLAIRIEANSIRYFDEYWMRKLLRIVRRDVRGMTAMAEYVAEGHSWTERVEFRFSPNRRVLTITRNSVDDKTLSETDRYYRCAATKRK